MEENNSLSLDDGAKIGVIGGGPTGSFFSIFALKMAKMLGKKLDITIFEPKDFNKTGPSGCNHCGGVISEILVQTLALEGIVLPDNIIEKGLDSFKFHTNYGTAHIETPTNERSIATVYRGGGPRGNSVREKESFDNFLLSQAIKEGAVHTSLKIDKIEYENKKPVLFSKGKEIMSADLVVGAFGLNTNSAKVFENMGFGYKRPKVVTGTVAEYLLDKETVVKYFGRSIHSFLLPNRNIRFAAIIPKGAHVTVCIIGSGINADTVKTFMKLPAVRKILPANIAKKPDCQCFPKINIKAPKTAFDDRVVICGDSGSTRYYKDGLSAAYYMGKAAAKTAVFDGVGKQHFQDDYYKTYKNIMIDNIFGKYLFVITDVYRSNKMMTLGMVKVIQKEQKNSNGRKVLSSIMWDIFTGNKKYKEVFASAWDLRMHIDLWKAFISSIL